MNGWLTLEGRVDWRHQHLAAEQSVSRIRGLTGISNKVKIKPSVNAANIRDDIIDALDRSAIHAAQAITVAAVGGQVRLSGTVHSPHAKQTAATLAWAAQGALHVQNDIAIL